MRRSRRRSPKNNILIFVAAFLIILLTGGFLFGYLPYTHIKAKGRIVLDSAKKVNTAFKTNDIDEVKKNLNDLQLKYDDLEKESKTVYWMRYIPLLGNYISDFKNGIEAGDSSLKAANLAVTSIEPYADLIGFKKGGVGFAEKTTDDRLQTAVLTLDKVLVNVDQISTYIDDARNHIDKIDPNRYPEKIGSHALRPQIQTAKDAFDGVASLFVDAKPLLKKLPEILGSQDPKTYVVLFQNDKELRPTGGFLTAYAIFNIDKGRMKVEKSTDIYNLDATIANHPVAPPEILKYHKGVSTFNIRDSNLSPDFVESVKLFNSLYDKSSERVDYDGVFTMDTQVLVDTLKILGPTSAGGIEFTANQDARCDCPQVIYELMNEIDRPVNYVKTNRKGLLGDLLYEIMQKALKSSPKIYWGPLSQVFMKDLQEKHILAYFPDASTQQAVEKVNFAGRIVPFDGDYLHINDTNFAGAKSNLFVQESVDSDSKFNSDGSVSRTITITYKNPYRSSDCNLERGGLCLNATLRNWLRIYVPKGSKLDNFTGSLMPTKTYDSLGKTVFEGFMTVNPEGKAEVVVKYTLPKGVDASRLMIQKQPGTGSNMYTIDVNGTKTQEFGLLTDKVLKLK
jgi:hypothetical protein